MLLAEELLLLLIHRKAKRAPLFSGTHAALAAAVLVELADITNDRVTVHTPPAPALDDVPLELAVTYTGLGLYPALLARLTDQGVLTRGSTRFRRPVWRLADQPRRDALVAELAAVLVDGQPPTPRTGALIALLHALDMTAMVHALADRSRTDAIAAESWPVSAFTAVVADCARSAADLPGVLLLDERWEWPVRPSGPPSPSP